MRTFDGPSKCQSTCVYTTLPHLPLQYTRLILSISLVQIERGLYLHWSPDKRVGVRRRHGGGMWKRIAPAIH
jgi:hypothetical protein